MYSGLKYLFQNAINCHNNNSELSGGLPHSEIRGSKPILGSSRLIAEYHVLHRLLLPRHSPNALLALDLIQKKTGSRLPRHKAGSSCAIPLNQKHTIPLLPMSNGRNLVSVLDLDNIASFSIRPPTEASGGPHSHARTKAS